LNSIFIGQRCPQCESTLWIDVFPALFRQTTPGQNAEIALVDGESTCFYHSAKRAVLPCHGCGRFLCALCDCELNGEHFCPGCLEVGKAKGKIKNLENRRTRYDSIAFSLAVLPVATIAFWFLTIVTAPLALFTSIRYWNAPLSIVRHSRIRFVLASAVAVVEIAVWGVGLYFIVSNLHG
jgi:hypothetical protein